MIRDTLRALVRGILGLPVQLDKLDETVVFDRIESLRRLSRYDDDRNLIRFGQKVYSQCDEDGIIREIFRRIGTTNKQFVEFGIGDGTENNTLALLFDGWTGLWIEGSQESTDSIRNQIPSVIDSGRLTVSNSFITVENIDQLISQSISNTEIDFLSVDIDGNDFHVFNAIECVRPRVIAMEYNAKFAPPIKYCMKYRPDHTWQRDDCFGASLKFLESELTKKGYALVGCSLSGANAFFVQTELVEDKFEKPFTAEHHFEPARYSLVCYSAGHKTSLKTLEFAMDQ